MDQFLKELEEMNLEQVLERKAAIEKEIREAANKEALEGMESKIEAINTREAELKELETRKQQALDLQMGNATPDKKIEERGKNEMSEIEKRAAQFVESGKAEIRAVLSGNTIAKPTKAAGVSGMAEVAFDIVDDVNAVPLTGNGAWTVGYQKTASAAADVTDGQDVGGTASTYDVVTINPGEWGVFDTVSNQVKKMTPVDYLAAVEDAALIALREKASAKIVAAVKASALLETRKSVALDATYIRNLVLNFRANKKKGGVALYISQADLATLGAVRGTNEKKAVYEIEFDPGTTTSGMIKDGGTAVRFRVLDSLTAGEQLFGQPKAIDMPMWDGCEIATDEGGEFFKKNQIAVRGIQTAGADLVAWHAMQLIKQSAT